MPFTTERTLTAERLAQYVARGRCERHLRFALFPSEAQGLLRRFGLETEPLSPLLSGAGQDFEREMVEELKRRAHVRDLRGHAAEVFLNEVRAQAPGRATVYYQPSLRARIGGCECEGRADLIEVMRDASGLLDVTVVDIKASARETVGFRLQVAFYARLVRESFSEVGLVCRTVGGAIAARDSSLTEDGRWQTFDLALYADEIERLVAAPDSDVARAARVAEGKAHYHLRALCDGCPYNALCFTDTAEREDLSLVPGLSVSEKRALRAEGIETARGLARLMRYGANGGAMETEPGSEQEVLRLSSRWPLAGRLPTLVQKARSGLNRFDRSVTTRRQLHGSGYGSLPDLSKYPDLVRVFVDAQRDYLEDRLYVVAARVVGPGGVSEIVEMTDAPPRVESERDMLVAWLQRLLPEVARVADAPRAPLHVYTYAPRGERALLEALTRHFDALCSVPAFYDLLTSHPALSQSMLSPLAEEVRTRLNLAPVCQNLYEVARELGFVWDDGETDFRKTFRARVFDNQRTFMRDARTGRFARGERTMEGEEGEAPPFVRVESAARFATEVPLEYVYAAWGRLGKTSRTNEANEL
ncbi:MAG TPA: PD-(D/E)XK nuclease family protein, partial [Pyrinomonadaceae bacterium]|nr:PD-(D/E)XK nuclease family protein [Pyrinomonadaceae bacterium]